MKSYKLVIAYDGTCYAGWQFQKNVISVAGTLQKVFLTCFGREIKLLGASRTDAGVHARGQVARFISDLQLGPEKIMNVWNHHLPNDILIKNLEICADDFNPRYHVQQKTYQYVIFKNQPDPFQARYGVYWPYDFSVEHLKECLSIFIGTHDFRSFCTGDYESTIRTIDDIVVGYDEKMQTVTITIRGRSFMQYMIRRIVGACLKAASKGLPIDEIHSALAAKNPHQKLLTAPAKGLILDSIVYDLLK